MVSSRLGEGDLKRMASIIDLERAPSTSWKFLNAAPEQEGTRMPNHEMIRGLETIDSISEATN